MNKQIGYQLKQGSSTPLAGPTPVRKQATQQEVGGEGWKSHLYLQLLPITPFTS